MNTAGLDLGEVPSSLVTKYRLVTYLDMSRNQITNIPPVMIQNMKQLRHFDCSYNELPEVPNTLQDLRVCAVLDTASTST